MKLVYCSFLGLLFVGALISPASAQITTDGSTNTTLTTTDNGLRIDDGERAGGNLFHSFGEFSVQNGSEAFFNNASDIVNIFSRVTGGNISNIDGLIRANGAANLFLINPHGIIFGESASLQIGGSFYGSTADSILFPDGVEFSATNIQRPILTINAPIGLNLRDNPGEIVNRSFAINSAGDDFVGLEVAPGNTLGLVGGNINFESGQATANGGNIELGTLSDAGTVTFNDDGSLSFPEDVARADIILSNFADIDVTGTGGGSITINGRNVSLSAGDFGGSVIRAGITADSTSAEAKAGDITINATDNITVDQSFIFNDVELNGVGNAGNITIDTTNLTLTNVAIINSSTFGEGNGGTLTINASETISVDNSSISSSVQPNAIGNAGAVSIDTNNLTLTNVGEIGSTTFGEGNAGAVSIDTNNLTLTNGAVINSSTFGEGNADTITISANDTISLSGVDSFGFGSIITSTVGPNAVGNAGEVRIDTNNLTLANGAAISSRIFGEGNADTITISANDTISLSGVDSFGFGSIINSTVEPNVVGNAGEVRIDTNNLTLTNGAVISSSTSGTGDAGTLTINASETISVDNSLISSSVQPNAVGNAGVLSIETTNLTLTNRGEISSSTFSEGNAGTLTINAADTIFVDNSSIGNSVQANAIGNAGVVSIETTNLTLTNRGQILSSTFGTGNAGTVNINAADTISLSGEGDDGFPTLITSTVNPNAIGNAGAVSIETTNLNLTNGGQIRSSTFGTGNAGTVTINSADTISVDNSAISSQFERDAVGNPGNVTINTTNLNLTNRGQISTATFGTGNAGIVTINAADTISVDNSVIGSTVQPDAVGNAGDVTINTNDLSLTNGAFVSSSNFNQGESGNVKINADSVLLENGQITATTASGVERGNIILQIAEFLTLEQDSLISARAIEDAIGGNIDINAEFIIAFPSSGNGNDIVASAEQGNGGDITITAQALLGIEEGTNIPGNGSNDIDASSQFGQSGSVTFNVPDTNNFQETGELSSNVLSAESVSEEACAATGQSGLILKGKGGVPPAPNLPLSSQLLLVDGKPITPNFSQLNNQQAPQNNRFQLQPIKTSVGDIYPARGVIKTEDGRVILTAYPTNNIATRTPEDAVNCHQVQ
ncbi:MAG: S-layer family protein [Xenococcaceae cyanobacterium MO_167.B27]|nr:S-layer family protein [Xenococcaceae cyanobacterium MO_167.B27]